MSSTQAKAISKILACAALFFFCGSVQAAAITTVNFKLLRGHLIVIPVTVNGTGPYEFLLDTGTDTTLVSPEFARQLGLRPLDRVELITVAGSQLLVRSQLEQLAVGAQTATGLAVLVSELREVRAVEARLCGVLGQNFLAQFNYLIDYRARRLEFETEAELETNLCGERLALEWHAGRRLVSVPSSSHTWRFVPDSGIAMLLLFPRAGQRHKLDWELRAPETWQARSDFGSRTVQRRQLRSFQFGRIRLYDLPVTFLTAAQASQGRIEDGLLPLSLFARVYFNHQKGYLILNPKAVE